MTTAVEGLLEWEGKGLGRVRIPDVRDFEYTVPRLARATTKQALATLGSASLTKERTQPWNLGPVVDQGNRPTCVLHALLGFLYAAPLMSREENRLTWTEEGYRWAQANDEWPGSDYDGTSVRAGIQFVRKELGRIQSFARVQTVDEMVAWLRSPVGGPMPIGVDLFEAMAAVGESGMGRAAGSWLGGHAMLCYWYDRARKLFRIRNSWGPSWGRGGDLLLPYADMKLLIEQLGGDAYAVSQTRYPGERLQSPFNRS
jgi:hypothetical protein